MQTIKEKHFLEPKSYKAPILPDCFVIPVHSNFRGRRSYNRKVIFSANNAYVNKVFYDFSNVAGNKLAGSCQNLHRIHSMISYDGAGNPIPNPVPPAVLPPEVLSLDDIYPDKQLKKDWCKNQAGEDYNPALVALPFTALDLNTYTYDKNGRITEASICKACENLNELADKNGWQCIVFPKFTSTKDWETWGNYVNNALYDNKFICMG